MRYLRDGSKINELERPIELVVKTKCPNKYKLVDMETGEEYVGTSPSECSYFWKKIHNA